MSDEYIVHNILEDEYFNFMTKLTRLFKNEQKRTSFLKMKKLNKRH